MNNIGAASSAVDALILSNFDYVADNQPKEAVITWDQFCARVKEPTVRADKDGELFSPARFDPKRRKKINVVELSALALDLDHGVTLDGDLPTWRNLGCAFAVYTTHSHKRVTDSNLDAEERFRVVLPLAEPVPALYWPALWQWANKKSGGKLDPNTKDQSRMLYWPAIAAAGAEYYHEIHDGRPLEWRELSALRYAINAFESELGELLAATQPALPGQKGRNDLLFESAAALGELIAGEMLDHNAVVKALEDAARKIGLDVDKNCGPDGIAATIKSGLSHGLRNPRRPEVLDGAPQNKAHTGASGAQKKKAAKNAGQQDGAGEQIDASDEGLTLAQLLIQLARDNAELFRDAGGDAYLTATIGDHCETYRLGSRDSKDWLAGLLYRETGRAASGDKINEALTVLRAVARHDAPEKEVHVRVAEHDGAIYFDLCDRDWRQVEITESNWRLVGSAESPVRFVRAKGMLPLPEPARGGSINELRELLNLPADDTDNWPMIIGWLVASLRPCNVEGFDYPLLAIHGEQGSAKSSAQRILRDLVDPNKATLRAAPHNERDLAIAAAHGRIISCDNLTYISEPLSNAFCRLATGGGFATRELFTDDGEVIFDAQRPVILNGISEVVTKSDLLDRTLLTQLPVIEKSRRWRKRILQRKFDTARPRILGALLSAVSGGLRRLKEGIELDEWPRMADFAEWAIACEKALGLADGAFIKAYDRNISRANNLAIEAAPVAQAIIRLVDGSTENKFAGTVGGLLKALNGLLEAAGQQPKHMQDWPKNSEKLRAELKKLAPNLRRDGIEIVFGDRTRKGRSLTITRLVPERQSRPSHRHQANEINDLENDGCRDSLENCEVETVTTASDDDAPRFARDGLDSDANGDRHANRHLVSHCKQRAGDGVTVVTVNPVPDVPATQTRKQVRI